MSSFDLYLGFPCNRFVRGVHWNIFLTVLVSGILKCLFVVFDIRDAMRMPHIVICDLSDYETFFYIISQTARLSENLIEHNTCVSFSLQFFAKHFSL
jgi:hypothetical protein